MLKTRIQLNMLNSSGKRQSRASKAILQKELAALTSVLLAALPLARSEAEEQSCLLASGKQASRLSRKDKEDQVRTNQKDGEGMDTNKGSLVQAKPPLVESFLLNGRLEEGEEFLSRHLAKHKHDDQSRFGLGMLQFLQAVELLTQNLYRYGIKSSSALGIPFLRVQTAQNPSPEEISYEKFRGIFESVEEQLLKAEATLADIGDPELKLPLHFGLIRLNMQEKGKASERLWKVYAELSRNQAVSQEKSEAFVICFDRGDVHWLRGYCHLLSAACQFYLAYDSEELFESTAHIFFPKVKSPYKFLSIGKKQGSLVNRHSQLIDWVAFLHLIRWEISNPERMKRALNHLESTVAQSKEMWKCILAETDDDREWIPNPRQTGVIPNVKVTDEMVASWLDLMDLSERVLQGKVLIAFWRGQHMGGVNLRKFFLEPRRFDLISWVQGPGAYPYLEKGECTQIETWRGLQRAFGSQFPGFALWFN